jgi:leucyl/phenylalanyl-tRNA---protein transferase
VVIDVDKMIAAYRQGAFPMGDPDTGELFVLCPDPRTVIPLDGFHVTKTLAAKIRGGKFPVTFDQAFEQVLDACADRPKTWITPPLRAAYLELHRRGVAHSVESWKDGQLAGGVYGLAVGAAFMGESMFHHFTDGGMFALAALVERLKERGYRLFDVQFMTGHLKKCGAVDVSRGYYLRRLAEAVDLTVSFG